MDLGLLGLMERLHSGSKQKTLRQKQRTDLKFGHYVSPLRETKKAA
jgi:hypothetical protein